jgi:hypothetical protein
MNSTFSISRLVRGLGDSLRESTRGHHNPYKKQQVSVF